MINILEIITGHTGVDHVTSADDASLYRSIFGGQDAVLNVGSQFEHTIISNNLIKIADGDLVIQGHQARIRTNDYEELVIDNGTPGMQRHDLIVARYEKDVVSGIESIKLAVVKGVAGAAAVDPELTQDDITSGGTLRELPLYRVKLNGINIEAVERMFETVSQDLMDLQYESGGNDDGDWVKLPDGRKKCSLLVELNGLSVTVAAGILKRSNAQTWTFPIPFEEPPIVSVEASINWVGWATLAGKPTNTSMQYVGIYPIESANPVPDVTFYLVAEGR